MKICIQQQVASMITCKEINCDLNRVDSMIMPIELKRNLNFKW